MLKTVQPFCIIVQNFGACVLLLSSKLQIPNTLYSSTHDCNVPCTKRQTKSSGAHVESLRPFFLIYLGRLFDAAKSLKSDYFHSLWSLSHQRTYSPKHHPRIYNFGRLSSKGLCCRLPPYTVQCSLQLQQWLVFQIPFPAQTYVVALPICSTETGFPKSVHIASDVANATFWKRFKSRVGMDHIQGSVDHMRQILSKPCFNFKPFVSLWMHLSLTNVIHFIIRAPIYSHTR